MFKHVREFLIAHRKTMVLLVIIGAGVVLGLYFGMDAKLVALIALVVGFVTNLFAGVIALVAVLPLIGPLIVKLLSIPIFWMINAVGHLASAVAVRKGYGSQMMNSRLLTVILMVGIAIGYFIGNWLPLN